MAKIHYIDEKPFSDKKVLLRVDFNVSLTAKNTIADDARIQQALPTINFLLKNKNKLIIVSHLGRPKAREEKYSLLVVCHKLQQYLPHYKIKLVKDFLTDKTALINQQPKEILVLENIRYYPEEKKNDPQFATKLGLLADVFVNDAFGVSHRSDASVVGVVDHIPSFGGLLLKKETEMISKAISNPKKPLVAIMGGSKISSKINLIDKLMTIADYVIVGGGLANTFLAAQGYKVGKSLCEKDQLEKAKQLLFLAAQKNTALILPQDVVVSSSMESHVSEVKKIEEIPDDAIILDVGPEALAQYGTIIAKAKTIIWNGPIGYFENPSFRRGTDFIYYAITDNSDCVSIVGGGDTLAAISKKEYLNKITHISTGGGAMLEFIEKGSLVGIDALRR